MKINAKSQFDNKTVKKHFNDQNILTNERENKKFVDNIFQANEKSLYGNSNIENLEHYFQKLKNLQIEWKKPNDIYKNEKFSLFKEDESDYSQLSEFSSHNHFLKESNFYNIILHLINYPDLIKSLFKGGLSEDSSGFYEICLFINGEWQVVTIDDYLPVTVTAAQNHNKYELVFSQANKNNLFIPLLEKALSLVYGSYHKLYSNQISPCKIFHTLTSLPYEILDIKKFTKDNVIDRVRTSLFNGEILFSGNDSNKILKSYGLQGNKYYKIFDYREHEYKGEKVEMVVLSKYEDDDWSGPWSEGDDLWTLESENLFDKNRDIQGKYIYMDIDDFMLFFSSIIICNLSTSGYNAHNCTFDSIDCTNTSFEIKCDVSPYVIEFEISSQNKNQNLSHFSIMREEGSQSHSHSKEVNTNTYILAIIALKDDDNNKLNFVDSKISQRNSDLHFSSDLGLGSYIIWLYTNSQEISKIKSFKLFHKGDVKLKSPFKDSGYQILSKIILSASNKEIESSSQCDLYIKQKSQFFNTKISYLYYHNKSLDKEYDIEINSSDMENLKILNYPNKQNGSKTMISSPPNNKGVFIAIVIDPSQRFTFDISYKYSEKILENNSHIKEEVLQGLQDLQVLQDLEVLQTPKPCEENNSSSPLFENETESNIETLHLIEKNHNDVFKEILNLKKISKEKNIKFASCSLIWKINKEYKNGFFTGQLLESTNQKHGIGVYTWRSGEKYVGFWKDDMQSDFGTQYSVTGDIIYEGDYLYSKKHGQGKLCLANGDCYTGGFEEDSFQGRGSYTWKDTGINWNGNFDKDKPFGFGRFLLPDGTCYEKEFNEDEN